MGPLTPPSRKDRSRKKARRRPRGLAATRVGSQGRRFWGGLSLFLLLPFTTSCNLVQLGTALQTLAKGLSSDVAVARADLEAPPGDPEAIARRNEIVTYLRRYATGLSRLEEVTLANAIVRSGRQNRTDYRLILAVIQTESTFSNWAISPKGAFGLMQVMPSTGRWLARKIELPWAGNASLFDPVTNVHIGTTYLARLRSRYGDLGIALLAYNRGPAAVESDLPPDPSTDPYVLKVLSHYRRFMRATTRADVRGLPGTPPA
jgi:soluble lytic murein transglycosylase-like protein